MKLLSLKNLFLTTILARVIPYTTNKVSFTLTWDNSWSVAGLPGNHDAIWVFVKYRECGVSGEWNHALLSTTMANHTLGASLAFAKPILTTDKWGTAGNFNNGALIKRSALGAGTTTGNVTMNIVGASNGIALNPALEYDITVIGIEMVQVKQGTNTVGDGNTYFYSLNAMPVGTIAPAIISSEAAGTSISTSTNYYNYYLPLPALFPKGVNEFYCMKYEISQGQYADFLNNIGSGAGARYYAGAGNNLYNIQLNAGVYNANGGTLGNCTDRACNWLSFNDLYSYLDWAALRPMTELEYERACRGDAGSQPNDYAWGSAGAAATIEAVNISGVSSGVEVCTDVDANCNYGGSTFAFTPAAGSLISAGNGPLGCGIFARDATQTRFSTGGSYWGIMELTGNVWESCVQIDIADGYPSTPNGYTGLWGDGQLNAGLYNVTNWPVAGMWNIHKGGGWDTQPGLNTGLSVSARNSRNNVDYNYKWSTVGGRGVR
jgi:formylglycine-generating enzyme required for sulfatase activity